MTNEVINNLCERFGVTSEFLIEEMTRYHLTRSIFGVVVVVVFLIISALIAYKSYPIVINKNRDYTMDDEDAAMWFLVPSVIIFITLTIVFFIIVADIIGYVTSPTAAVIDDILRSMSK